MRSISVKEILAGAALATASSLAFNASPANAFTPCGPATLGSLNNNYSGGEFIMFGDEYIKLDKGDIVVFPSNFLYPHRVEPVTNGTRYSFVSWVW